MDAVAGAADPLPSTDGWELVLAENVARPVDDERRRGAMDWGRVGRDRAGADPGCA
jgi:hypothetical protein